jgi:hypothetical protein
MHPSRAVLCAAARARFVAEGDTPRADVLKGELQKVSDTSSGEQARVPAVDLWRE